MHILLTLLLLAPSGSAKKVPELEKHLENGRKKEAVVLLKEIGALKRNHAEAEALVRLILKRKLREPELLEAGFLALKGIGSKEVTRELLWLLDNSPLRKQEIARIGVCRALEGAVDTRPPAVDAITDLLRDKSDKVIAAAAEACGAYRHAKEPIRKELFEDVLGIYVGTWNMKNTVDPDLKKEKRRAEQKWEIIEKPMERTLQLLSNVTQEDPPAWRRFWNKNKYKRWRDLDN